ncbi:MAG: FixH family protein [Bacteroidota bacterium]|nr:FixH family protein [Bacteroidota bacterium]
MNWGNKIALLYIGFVIMIGFLVYKSTQQHTDLVSDDYYNKEIAYQKIIDANNNSHQLTSSCSILHNNNKVQISFPEELKNQLITGKIELYNAANAKNDTSFNFSCSQTMFEFDLQGIRKGNYTVKINFDCNRKNYYTEQALNLFE